MLDEIAAPRLFEPAPEPMPGQIGMPGQWDGFTMQASPAPAPPAEEESIVDLLDRRARQARERQAELRRLVAELYALDTVEEHRCALGHDYGGGQRRSEIMRLERRIDDAKRNARTYGEPTEIVPTRDEALEAFERLIGPKERRIEREDYRRSTPATTRTVKAYQRARRALEAR